MFKLWEQGKNVQPDNLRQDAFESMQDANPPRHKQSQQIVLPSSHLLVVLLIQTKMRFFAPLENTLVPIQFMIDREGIFLVSFASFLKGLHLYHDQTLRLSVVLEQKTWTVTQAEDREMKKQHKYLDETPFVQRVYKLGQRSRIRDYFLCLNYYYS